MQESIDGQTLGPLAQHTYQVIAVKPGQHVLSVEGQANKDSLILEGKPGEIIFVRVDVHLGWNSGRVHAEIVDAKTGTSIVKGSNLALHRNSN